MYSQFFYGTYVVMEHLFINRFLLKHVHRKNLFVIIRLYLFDVVCLSSTSLIHVFYFFDSCLLHTSLILQHQFNIVHSFSCFSCWMCFDPLLSQSWCWWHIACVESTSGLPISPYYVYLVYIRTYVLSWLMLF